MRSRRAGSATPGVGHRAQFGATGWRGQRVHVVQQCSAADRIGLMAAQVDPNNERGDPVAAKAHDITDGLITRTSRRSTS